MTRAFVVLNPAAGNSDPGKVRAWLEERRPGGGWQYEIYETTGKEDLPAVVREALQRGFDLVVAVGGDGTVSGVASGFAAAREGTAAQVPMAIVPLGTGNALARALGVPLQAEQALELAFGSHHLRQIDVMHLGERFFLANVTVGLSAQMMKEADSEEKQRFGLLAYVAAAVTTSIRSHLEDRQNRHFALTVDGEARDLQASEILVLNTGILGLPNLELGLDVCLDDGEVDVYVVPAGTLAESVLQMLQLISGGEDGASDILHLTARRDVSIQADGPLPVQADGEPLGETPVEIEVIPAAVAIVVPPHDR